MRIPAVLQGIALVFLVFPRCAAELPVAPEDNLVANPGFEDGTGWTFRDWDTEHNNVEGVFDEDEARSGRRSARITRAHTESAAQFISDPVKLKAEARYRLGGHIRADVTEGPGPRIFLGGGPGRAYIQAPVRTDWRQYSEVFETGSQPVTVRIYCRLASSVGTAWFDDVFLEEIPADEPLNLLMNSSFEHDRGWTFRDWDTEHNNVEGVFDEDEARSGHRSARITRVHTEAAAQFVSDPVTLKADTRYRLGGHIRADVAEGPGPHLILLTPDFQSISPRVQGPRRTGWREFSEVFETGGRPVEARFYCRLQNSVGTAWFDDVFLVEIPAD